MSMACLDVTHLDGAAAAQHVRSHGAGIRLSTLACTADGQAFRVHAARRCRTAGLQALHHGHARAASLPLDLPTTCPHAPHRNVVIGGCTLS
eukprot:365906-Chlamydomonas_euryale.AAC.4